MKLIWATCIVLILSGCSVFPASWKSQELEDLQLDEIRAVYFVTGNGMLPNHELEDSSEIFVVHSFLDLQMIAAQSRVALLIDKDSLQHVNANWLHQEPQKFYPLIVLGYCEPLFVFREVLPGFSIEGPGISWDVCSLEHGYSVWALYEDGDIFMKGYSQDPTVDELQQITKSLLNSFPLELMPLE